VNYEGWRRRAFHDSGSEVGVFGIGGVVWELSGMDGVGKGGAGAGCPVGWVVVGGECDELHGSWLTEGREEHVWPARA